MAYRTTCDFCGAPIELVLVVPDQPRKGTTRKHVPLDLDFDTASSATPPSHALSAGRTTCRPITADRPLEHHEHPALTHFATCPARQRPPAAPRPAHALTAQESR
ncbi:hypothetical protein ACTHAM_002381 [Cellulomonas soli]|uniref:hypothetical protein n=1 Tax=Cellulomonas soli TaxID=931535 RepID=UPI003F84EED6